jgi:hypothetical protein
MDALYEPQQLMAAQFGALKAFGRQISDKSRARSEQVTAARVIHTN